jgi:hypothetical protein
MSIASAEDLDDLRVHYAVEHENSGSPARRLELVTARAARAMRDGNRYMDGSPQDGLPRISRAPQRAAAAAQGRGPGVEAEAGR